MRDAKAQASQTFPAIIDAAEQRVLHPFGHRGTSTNHATCLISMFLRKAPFRLRPSRSRSLLAMQDFVCLPRAVGLALPLFDTVGSIARASPVNARGAWMPPWRRAGVAYLARDSTSPRDLIPVYQTLDESTSPARTRFRVKLVNRIVRRLPQRRRAARSRISPAAGG
jgi:hypothetical protein